MWLDIVQEAVDATWDIDLLGVLMLDSSASSVVIDGEPQRPSNTENAQYAFKEEMLASGCLETDSEEEDDEYFGEDIQYLKRVRTIDTTAIGDVMTMRIQSLKGVKPAIKYPTFDKAVEDIRKSKSRNA